MSKKVSILILIISVLLAILITFQVTFIALDKKYRAEFENYVNRVEAEENPDEKDVEGMMSSKAYQKIKQVDKLYHQLYIGEIDEEKLVDGILDGYVYGTGDQYAYYLNKDEYAELIAENNAELVGIGVQVIYDENLIKIISVMPDSPALEAGLLPGDQIYAVEGELASELGYNPTINRVKGEAGTEVKLTVRRGNDLIDFKMTRAKVVAQSIMYHAYEKDPTIGIIRITGFDLGTPSQFKNACETLMKNGAKRFVFDVRYNPGGDLSAITEILDYLLPEGPIVRIVDKEGKEVTYGSDAAELDVPMCVLVNGNTASAAELFSSALKDYKKATIIGTVTFGKGTVQQILSLGDGSGIGISYRMYCPPFSDNYEGIGVQPDVVLELDEKLAEKNIYLITDEEDNQLQKAIEILNQK